MLSPERSRLRPDRPGTVATTSASLRYWNSARQRHCRPSERYQNIPASLPTRSPSHPRKPARKAGFSTFESGCGRETDCLLEGDGFEPSVPREGPTRRDGFFQTLQRRLGSAPSAIGDLNRAIWAAISAGTISSATATSASAGDGGRLKTAALLTGDRWFESCSLQRRDAMGQAARTWHHRRCNQLTECPDAPAERLEQIPRRLGPR